MKCPVTVRWIGAAWARSPFGWAILVLPIAFLWALNSVPALDGESAPPRAEQVGLLALLGSAGWAVARLGEAQWLFSKLLPTRRIGHQAIVILMVNLVVGLVYWAGAHSLDSGVSPSWSLVAINWIQVSCLSLFILQLPVGRAGKWGLLIGLVWILPAALPAFRSIGAATPSSESWSPLQILPPIALLLATYLIALSNGGGAASDTQRDH